ncbi:MAG: exo-alpha-sialidase [Gemmatimonadota bacterium]|nr:exo-alpha-sialidase [Gemmatimonadota bacterium]
MALSAGTVSAAQAEKPYYRAELIFEPSLCFPRCHSSQIHALPDGGLIAAWWNGSEEAGKDNVIRGARRPAGADYWETPMILGDTPDTTEGNPVFFSASQNELWLFYRAGFPWAKLMWTKSADLGETWSTPEAFWDKTGWALRSRIIRLRNGNIVIPALTYGSPKWELNRAQTIFIYSEDNGKSWKNTEMVRTDPGNNEAALFQRDDGSLLAYMRPYDLDRKDRFLWQCESFDNGRTWTEAKRTGIQNPSKAIELLKLINGHVVLAFNDTQNNLSSLSLALSLDDGRTWSHKRVLENSPGRFTYPALAQTPDGRIHVSYTFRRTHVKHAELNEAWIMDKQ